jgi:hypothetical protein
MRAETMRKRLIVIGAICGVLAAAFFTGVAIFIFKARQSRATQVRSASTAASTSPFANLPESAIPGRYKYISGDQENFITLYEDHSFMNKDGTILPVHRWDLTPEGLVLQWKTSTSLYDQIEMPGIYTGAKSDGTTRRLEKQENVNPAELLKPLPPPRPAAELASMPLGDVIAFIRLGATCETNNLTPVNTGNGDGKIFPGSTGGVECYQLMRKPGRPSAYLYLRIAPELKEPPFTSAMVVVEYFDSAPGNAGGSFAIQYDSPAGAYQQTPKRVPLTGSEMWKEAWFVLDTPAFRNRQNAQGDFRLAAVNPDLFVRSVKLVKNPRPSPN